MLSKKMFNQKNFSCEIFPIIQFENVKFSLSESFNQKEKEKKKGKVGLK